MPLETMRPNPAWDAASHEDAVETFEDHRADLRFTVWGGDWCTDCRRVLPDFGAALEAADVPDDRIQEIAVDREKRGPDVDEYDVERIPTIVVEDDEGTELARFVEEEPVPPAIWIAERVEAALDSA